MRNNFFSDDFNNIEITNRISQIENGRVGFYSIGLYPASLAYNCAMQGDKDRLLLAPRKGRDIFGAFSPSVLKGMDQAHMSTLVNMSTHINNNEIITNSLEYLILNTELLVLSSNSNHIQRDLEEAISLRSQLRRENVLITVLSGSFNFDRESNQAFLLTEKSTDLAFFSGFHRHGALRSPLDSFTANFCHPDSLTALFGARLLDKLSPNIQVSPGLHNLEAQYIKAAKNISSIFSGFAYSYHANNTGLLPTIFTLLSSQCLDQAATVSNFRTNYNDIYRDQLIPLTDLGYGVTKIQASLFKKGNNNTFRDHTFSQLTAIVADLNGSMLPPLIGVPTRNFQAGQVLAHSMKSFNRLPSSESEFYQWCDESNLSRGSLEGLKSLEYWPQIIKRYSLPLHDCSLVNLLYMSVYGPSDLKDLMFSVLTQSRELANYCQESVRPSHSRTITDLLSNISDPIVLRTIVDKIKLPDFDKEDQPSLSKDIISSTTNSTYIRAMNFIEDYLS